MESRYPRRERKGTAIGQQYRAAIQASVSRAESRKAKLLEKYEAVLTGQIIPEVERARELVGELHEQITAYQNTPGGSPSDAAYKRLQLQYEMAVSNYIRVMKTVASAAVASASAAAVAVDEEDAALAAEDAELAALLGGLGMAGGSRRRRTHRKGRRAHLSARRAHLSARRAHLSARRAHRKSTKGRRHH